MSQRLPEDTDDFVIRIKMNDEVFFVAPELLLEELDGLRYHGFGQWKSGAHHRAAPIDQLLTIQKDLRLFVQVPSGVICPCDLSFDEVNADPYELIAAARANDQVLWEYIPAFGTYKPATTPQDQLAIYAHAWERALF